MTSIRSLRRACVGALLALSISASAQTTGLQDKQVFDGYSPLATTTQLAVERFTVYVPPGPPSRGHGPVMFVPPWPNAVVPRRWRKAVDELDARYSHPAALELSQKLPPR